MGKKLKYKFLDAVLAGKLGKRTEGGLIVTLMEFKKYFEKDDNKSYLSCYFPSVTIESGLYKMQHNRFLFRVSSGVYKIHEEALIRHHQKLPPHENIHI